MNTLTFLVVMFVVIGATLYLGRWSKESEIEDGDLEALRRIHRTREDA